MKYITRTVSTGQKLPATNVISLLDSQLIIILRPWGSAEFNQKFSDEVSHYLSSTQADIEVTTPFDYQENLSQLANRTRVALLLAHDLFYKSENKNEYLIGFEATILFKEKNELAWSSVGRFEINKIIGSQLSTMMKNGSDLDSEVLLPVQLIGVEREIDISSGSLTLKNDDKVVVASCYKCDLQLNDNSNSNETAIEVRNSNGSAWYTLFTS